MMATGDDDSVWGSDVDFSTSQWQTIEEWERDGDVISDVIWDSEVTPSQMRIIESMERNMQVGIFSL